MSTKRSEIFDLPLSDQLQLVEDLWDHIADSPERLPIPDWQKRELDRRKLQFTKNPEAVVDWETVKSQLRQQ